MASFKIIIQSFLEPSIKTCTISSTCPVTYAEIVKYAQNYFKTGNRAISIYPPSYGGLPYSYSEMSVHDIVLKQQESNLVVSDKRTFYLVDQVQEAYVGMRNNIEFKPLETIGDSRNAIFPLCYTAPISVVRSLVYHHFLYLLKPIEHISFVCYSDNTLCKDFGKERKTQLFFENVSLKLLKPPHYTYFKVSFMSSEEIAQLVPTPTPSSSPSLVSQNNQSSEAVLLQQTSTVISHYKKEVSQLLEANKEEILEYLCKLLHKRSSRHSHRKSSSSSSSKRHHHYIHSIRKN